MARNNFKEAYRAKTATNLAQALQQLKSACETGRALYARIAAIYVEETNGIATGDFDQADVDYLAPLVTPTTTLDAAMAAFIAAFPANLPSL